MKVHRWAAAVAIASATLTVAALALATHAPVSDPNDTRGPLDVRRVKLEHEDGPGEWTVLTFAEWTPRSMWDVGNAFVFLDTAKNQDAEYFVHIRSNGRRMVGALWRIGDRRDRLLRGIAAWRDSRDGVSVRVRLGQLTFGGARRSFRWWVYTSFSGIRCRATCVDRAPNSGAVEQWRPGFSPTPSPSGSPTGPSGPSGSSGP